MHVRSWFLAAVALATAATQASGPKVRVDLEVYNAKQAAAGVKWALGDQGKVIRVGQNTVTVEVYGSKPRRLIDKVTRMRGVVKANPIAPPNPSRAIREQDISKVNSMLDGYKANYLAYYRAKHGDAATPEKYPGTGYLEAYRQWLDRRTYPFDSIDWSATTRAEQHRDVMPVSRKLGHNIPGLFLSGGWEYVGPKNLDIPYRIYYGQPPLGGRTDAVAIDPTNSSVLWAAGAQGGIWKSVDGGANWQDRSTGWPHMRIESIAIHPTNGNIIYVGTGDGHGGTGPGYGIQKSTDGGATWTIVGGTEMSGRVVQQIIVDPETPTTVYACTGVGAGRIFKSTDSGTTWTAVNMTNPSRDWYGMTISGKDGSNVRIIYAIADNGGIVKSEDRGTTWADVTFPVTVTHGDIAASPVNPTNVYVVESGAEAIYKSTDKGATWTNTTNNFPGGYNWSQAWYDMHIACSYKTGNVDVVYVGLIDVVQSPDAGATWRNAGKSYFGDSNLHNDQHSFAINPRNPGDCLVGNDGGVFRLAYNTDGGNDTVSFTSLNKNYFTTMFYYADFHPTDRTYMIGGTQDNAAPAALGNLDNWRNPGAGDGAGQGISKQNPATQYTSSQGLGIRRTNNYWQTSNNISPDVNGEAVPFIGMVYVDPNNGDEMYTGTNYLHRYNNLTNSWTYRLGGQDLGSGQTISSIHVALGNSNRVFVGARGKVYASIDKGASFIDVSSGGLPNRWVQDIAANPANPDDVIAVVSGAGPGHVFRCANIQSPSRVWVDVSGAGGGALPDTSVNTIALDADNPMTTWYIGTDIGVFTTEDSGASWANATEPLGLPNVPVTDLFVQAATKSLYAATFGRGIFRIDIGVNLIESFTLSPSSIIGGLENSVGIVRLTAAQASDVTFNIASNPSSAVIHPATVTIGAGFLTGTFDVTSRSVQDTTNVRFTISGEFGNKSANLVVRPIGLANPLTVWPGRMAGGNAATCYVRLNGPAPAGGASVYLNTTRPDLAWPERNWIVIPEGQTETRFRVYSRPVTQPQLLYVTANRAGTQVRNDLTLNPAIIESITPVPTTVRGGNTSRVTIRLDGTAPNTGAVVRLTSSNTSKLTVPSTVVVPPGYRTVEFTVNTVATGSPINVSITAQYINSSKSATITVVP